MAAEEGTGGDRIRCADGQAMPQGHARLAERGRGTGLGPEPKQEGIKKPENISGGRERVRAKLPRQCQGPLLGLGDRVQGSRDLG